MNTYGYVVVGNVNNFPLHIVEIRHTMLAAFSVFSNAKDARDYIEKEKRSLENFSPLEYDSNFKFSEGLMAEYRWGNALFSKVENHQLYIEKSVGLENYKLVNYFDVWGDEEGWQVNNLCVEMENIAFPKNATNKDILQHLERIGFLTTSDENKVTIEDLGEILEIVAVENLEPLGRLEKIA